MYLWVLPCPCIFDIYRDKLINIIIHRRKHNKIIQISSLKESMTFNELHNGFHNRLIFKGSSNSLLIIDLLLYLFTIIMRTWLTSNNNFDLFAPTVRQLLLEFHSNCQAYLLGKVAMRNCRSYLNIYHYYESMRQTFCC